VPVRDSRRRVRTRLERSTGLDAPGHDTPAPAPPPGSEGPGAGADTARPDPEAPGADGEL